MLSSLHSLHQAACDQGVRLRVRSLKDARFVAAASSTARPSEVMAGTEALPEVEWVRGPQGRREAVPSPSSRLCPVPGRAPREGREGDERQGYEAPHC